MDRTQVTAVFNLGFRRGANDRAAAGLVISRTQTPPPPASVPEPPANLTDGIERSAWREGYSMGYTMGSSDAELEVAEQPAADGMVKALEPEMLELFGVFKRLSGGR